MKPKRWLCLLSLQGPLHGEIESRFGLLILGIRDPALETFSLKLEQLFFHGIE